MIMKCQLVLQFTVSSLQDYDDLVQLEEELSQALREVAKVDGHDVGSGEFNVFLMTDSPESTFRDCFTLLETLNMTDGLRAAYRELGQNEYTILWPSDLADFRIT